MLEVLSGQKSPAAVNFSPNYPAWLGFKGTVHNQHIPEENTFNPIIRD